MDEKKRNRGIIATSFIGILGNLVLVAVKAFVGIFTKSSSIISDAINNLSDAMSSTVTIVGTKLSSKRPDKKHPFGYGRIEYLTATVVAAIILFAGGSAIYESIVSLVSGDKPTYDTLAFVLISVGIVIKLGLGIYFKIQGKRYGSAALKNSGTDALFDVLLSSATLITAIISHFTNVYLEGYAGILIGLFILRSGFIAMKESLSPIIGERMDDELARQIKAEICAIEEVRGAYDLIIHSYGESKLIGSVHIEVDDELDASKIYDIERQIQGMMMVKHQLIMTVGIYASNDANPTIKALKMHVYELARKEEGVLQCHGFYLDQKTGQANLDIVVSFKVADHIEEMLGNISKRLEEAYPDIHFNLNIDQDFSA